jgi:hypothetical protein
MSEADFASLKGEGNYIKGFKAARLHGLVSAILEEVVKFALHEITFWLSLHNEIMLLNAHKCFEALRQSARHCRRRSHYFEHCDQAFG